MPVSKKFLDEAGLQNYHTGVIAALKEKTNKPFIGDREPTSSDIRIEDGGSIWFDTSEDNVIETEMVNLMSIEEELTFNNDEELTFNNNDEDDNELTRVRSDNAQITFYLRHDKEELYKYNIK